MRDDEQKTSEDNQKMALEHVRAVWLYHSDQRVKNFNIYVIFVGILIAGYAKAIELQQSSTVETTVDMEVAIAWVALVITLAFLLINWRNELLIHDCHEELLCLEPLFGVRLMERDRQRGRTSTNRRHVGWRLVSHGAAYKGIFVMVGGLAVYRIFFF
jgi:hypothetical protein